MPNLIEVEEERAWDSLPEEEKRKVRIFEQWTSRIKMAESTVWSVFGLMQQFNFSKDKEGKFGGYLHEILLEFQSQYDKETGDLNK